MAPWGCLVLDSSAVATGNSGTFETYLAAEAVEIDCFNRD